LRIVFDYCEVVVFGGEELELVVLGVVGVLVFVDEDSVEGVGVVVVDFLEEFE